MSRNFGSIVRNVSSDGSGQDRRMPPALKPDYVRVDERSIADLIAFTLNYSTGLGWWDPVTNQPAGDWQPFLCADPADPPATDDDKIKRDAVTLAKYLDDPAAFAHDPATRQLLSRPQLALFLTFLHVREGIRAEMNALLDRHLQFYYGTCLGLAPLPAVPDQAHVVFTPSPAIPSTELPAGALLNAGHDSSGKPLQYATARPVIVNQATLAQTRSTFCLRRWIGLPEARVLAPTIGQGLEAMLTLAVGQDWQLYMPSGMATLEAVKTQMKAGSDEAANYVTWRLYLSEGEFFTFMAVQEQALAVEADAGAISKAEWEAVYSLLTAAHDRYVNARRAATLQGLNYANNGGETGLTAMFTAAVGEPRSKPVLPVMPDGATSLYTLYDWLTGPTTNKPEQQDQKDAGEYVRNYLFMPTDRFESIVATSKSVTLPTRRAADDYSNPSDAEQSWLGAYASIEQAGQRKWQTPVPPAGHEVWGNLYAAADATTLIPPETAARPGGADNTAWRTLGGTSTCPGSVSADLGFAIASPVLNLSTGNRTVRMNLSFLPPPAADAGDTVSLDDTDLAPGNKADRDIVAALGQNPWRARVSSASGWLDCSPLTVDSVVIAARTAHVVQAPDAAITQDNTALTLNMLVDGPLTEADVGSYFVDVGGALYRIATVNTAANTAAVDLILHVTFALTPPTPPNNKPSTIPTIYPPAALALQTLQATFSLTTQDAAVAAPTPGAIAGYPDTSWPVAQLLLADLSSGKTVGKQKTDPAIKLYQPFNTLMLDSVKVSVTVGDSSKDDATTVNGLSRDLWLQNDQTALNPAKPFLPWGSGAATGARFYLAHPELCQKPLDSLSLVFNWVGVPSNLLNGYYTGYGTSAPVDSTHIPNANLQLFDLGSIQTVAPTQPLFAADSSVTKTSSPIISCADVPGNLAQGFTYAEEPDALPADKSFPQWQRYWILELGTPDFQVSGYSAAASTAAKNGTSVNPPYIPNAQCVGVAYTSSAGFDFTKAPPAGSAPPNLTAYHVLPFGCATITPLPGTEVQAAQAKAGTLEANKRAAAGIPSPPAADTVTPPASPSQPEVPSYPFLPPVENEGELFLGIANLAVPGNLSLLFQMAEGSANPDVSRPVIEWSYLSQDSWIPFPPGNVLDDTNGLIQSGVAAFQIPPDATTSHSCMPSGLCWLCASTRSGSDGACNTISILPQAVRVVFKDQGNTADHYAQPLPPGSITALTQPRPGITKVNQPYSSFGGAPAEADSMFYTTASERLRHKSRALSPWDYERLVLAQFPQVHSTLCLSGPAIDEVGSGALKLVVVPETQGLVPFDPFEPKVPADILARIGSYLEVRMPPAATVEVASPQYIPIKIKVGVRLKAHVDSGKALAALQKKLQQYLAPWAFDPGEEISFNAAIYADGIIAFLQEQPGVDYCGNIALYQPQSNRNNPWREIEPGPRGVLCATTPVPGSVLTSAAEHDIFLIADAPYDTQTFSGIAHMEINLDFKVAGPAA